MTRIIVAVIVALVQTVGFEPAQPDLFGAGANFVNAWADYDADGDADLFVGFDGTPNRLYRNDRGTFANVAEEAGLADARSTRAAAWGDYDATETQTCLWDATPGPAASVTRLYRNDPSPGGRDTASPRFSVLDGSGRATHAGAEVRVFAAGTTHVVAARLVDSGSGYDAQSDLPVHLGLGSRQVDVEVVFPRAGIAPQRTSAE